MISETDLLWWCSLHKAFALTDIRAVCDLGQQEFFCDKPALYERVVRQFAALCGMPDVDISACRTSADVWRALGREIVSLDVVGNGPDFHYFDLNTDAVPGTLMGRFDFVTNVGTSEHVLNQLNTFKVMHDLTRRGGIMVHAVPAAGFSNHGFFHYNLKLFWRLAKANAYDCLDAWMSCDKDNDHLARDVGEFIRGEHGSFRNTRMAEDHPLKLFGDLTQSYRSTEGCLYVFLRKNVTAEFEVALDLPDDMDDRLPPRDDGLSQGLGRRISRRAAALALRKVLNPLTRRVIRLAS